MAQLPPDESAAKQEATAEEFKAMAHPLRLRILRWCLHEAHTNKEIADHFGKDPATTLHHVRLLVRTGFLVAEPVRAGQRGALEKPYRATGRTWNLALTRPEDQSVETLAVIDALREEVAEAGPDAILAGARMGLKLSDERAAELTDRIEDLVQEYASAPSDEDGRRYGLYVNLHRLR
jgi:DNA-binding transcriptional ArsR family regulator